jgi:hypothetical protein
MDATHLQGAMMTQPYSVLKKFAAALFLALAALQLSGCHRSEADFDDRTLGQKPHVETVTPENRRDVFRP